MAAISNLFFVSILLLASLLSTCVASSEARRAPQSLPARLQMGPVAQCWDSLMELRSCTGEVILFFLNGETYLGPSCCRAIRVIEHQCWAADAMLTALGFTPEEGDVLRGFCDATEDFPVPPSPPAAPAPASKR